MKRARELRAWQKALRRGTGRSRSPEALPKEEREDLTLKSSQR